MAGRKKTTLKGRSTKRDDPASRSKQFIRMLLVLCTVFLMLYFADSSTRLFVKHALVFNSLAFGGLGLLASFFASFIGVAFLLRYLRGIWFILALLVVVSCIIVAETAFRVTGVPLNTFHVGLFIEAKTDAANALGEYGAVIWSVARHVCGVVIPGIVALRLIRWRPSGRSVIATCGGAVLLLSIGTFDYEGQIFVPAPMGLPVAAARMYSNQQFQERGPVQLKLAGDNPIKHFIYIVDETIRADHISLNDRTNGVTPWLANYSGVVSLGEAVSASNCSVAAQYMLRTGIIPAEIPDLERKTLIKPNIFAYALQAGRKAYFVDGQSDIYTNYMSPHDLVGVNWEMGVTDKVESCKRSGECRLIARLREIVAQEQKTFTYVVKNAAHWPYRMRYPESQTVYQPAPVGETKNPERIKNSYRNAIRWNVDNFFKDLLGEKTFQNYLIIYTGDHGEDLAPAEGFSPHCGHDNKVRAIEGIVPILLFTDNAGLHSTFQQVAAVRSGKTSQFDLFPSWLTLMGYERNQVLKAYGPSIFDAQLRRRQFYWGDLFHNYGAFYRVR